MPAEMQNEEPHISGPQNTLKKRVLFSGIYTAIYCVASLGGNTEPDNFAHGGAGIWFVSVPLVIVVTLICYSDSLRHIAASGALVGSLFYFFGFLFARSALSIQSTALLLLAFPISLIACAGISFGLSSFLIGFTAPAGTDA